MKFHMWDSIDFFTFMLRLKLAFESTTNDKWVFGRIMFAYFNESDSQTSIRNDYTGN